MTFEELLKLSENQLKKLPKADLVKAVTQLKSESEMLAVDFGFICSNFALEMRRTEKQTAYLDIIEEGKRQGLFKVVDPENLLLSKEFHQLTKVTDKMQKITGSNDEQTTWN